MKRKFLSVFLSALMVMLMLPTQVFAADETVYISISDDGLFVENISEDFMAYFPVSFSEIEKIRLSDYNLESYKVDNDKDGNEDITVLHLYLYIHENYYKDGIEQFVKGISGSRGSIFFESFWGHDCNLNYYVNGEYPLMYEGWGATADTIVITPGDVIDIMMFTSWGFYSDSGAGFHNFFFEDKITHRMTATAGEKTEFQLKRGYGNIQLGGATEYVPVGNVPVYYSKTGLYADDAKTVEADENGNISITFPTDGKWYVWMDGQKGLDADIENIVSSPTYMEISVESKTEPGDINRDGSVNPVDVVLLRKILLNSEKYPITDENAADVNADGEVNPVDVVLLRKFLLNSEKYPLG